MNLKATKSLYVLGAVLLVGSVVSISERNSSASPAPANFRGNDFFHGKELVGTWRVTVQQYNCQTHAPVAGPFAALLTYADGGTMTGSTTNPAFAIGQRGPDQGIWSQEGRRTYISKDSSFLFFTTAPNPPANPGFSAGQQTLTQTIEFKNDPDQFESDATVEFTDMTGKVYRQGCASATATRYE
ncbi:MAG TPA: hypothetical protein VK525_17605 [Candidatus Saccharimonadales bacterium]|nr:hypothetical protein [Candidatus Saccharimonadales bacterium]